MTNHAVGRTVAIVIGSAELASAIAVKLDRSGVSVVLCDDVDPDCLRRGMSFNDAWYVGTVYLDGSRAVFCSTAKSIPTVIERRDAIAATTWSWPGVAKLVAPSVIIDARCTYPGRSICLIELAPKGAFTIGATPWHVANETAHIVMWPFPGPAVPQSGDQETAWDPLSFESHRIALRTHDSGRFCTSRNIGDYVLCGSPLGVVGRTLLSAPASGVLSGLLAPGSRVHPGAVVAEVDTRGQPARCFGVSKWCESIADDVVRKVTSDADYELA